MKNYETLVEAIEDLKKRGYTEDFSMQPDHISNAAKELKINPEDFEVKEVYRFEGMSNPGDNSVVYAIAANDGTKGLLVDAYGAYAEDTSKALIEKLTIKGR